METQLPRKTAVILFLLIPFFISGQDWQNICTSGKIFYVNSSNNIEGIYFKGITPAGNGDTLYTTFEHWRPDPIGYSLQYGSPIFLKYILKKQNGCFTFYQLSDADTIFKVIINTRVSLNDSWVFYQVNVPEISWKERVDATFTTTGIDTILGYVDSVKVFTLQRKDTAGNPIADPINGKTVILGKDLGLVQTFDFYNMLNSRTQYFLAGKDIPFVGIHELTGRELFDFQPGDVFNYSGHAYTENLPPPWAYDYTYQESREILAKDSTDAGYKYRILKCIRANGTPAFHFRGIVDVNLPYESFANSPYDKMPWEELYHPFTGGNGANYYLFKRKIRVDGRQEKQILPCGICCTQYGCFVEFGNCDCFPDDYTLAEGLGIIHQKYQFDYDNMNVDLVYYKKGNYTYGVPNIDCPPFGYRLVPLNGNTYYSDGSGNMKVLKVDSVNVLSGTDSIFYTFPAIRKIQGLSCYDTAGGSIFGRKIIQRDLAVYQLLNEHYDTLQILTAYDPGTKWTFCNLPDGNRIEATILSKYADTILGVPDTVKIIQFQSKNINGQNISHIMNGKAMELSNSFGFSKMYDFTLLPDSLVEYKLIGSDSPRKGIRALTWDQIYNFDVGDQFGYTRIESTTGQGNHDSTVTTYVRTILDKKVTGNHDSVTYTSAICQRTVRYLASGGSIVTPSKDTVYQIFSKDSFPYDGFLDRCPDEFSPRSGACNNIADRFFMSDTSEYSGRLIRGADMFAYTRNAERCWMEGIDPGTLRITYADGLGEVEEKTISPLAVHIFIEKLVGYKKQNETWGTIPNVDCTPSPGVKDPARPAEIVVKIVPSPVKSNAKVIIETSKVFHVSDFFLYDLSGKEVLHIKLNRKETSFSRQNMPSGIYSWRFIMNDITLTGKIVFE